jgi:hypothetical protein
MFSYCELPFLSIFSFLSDHSPRSTDGIAASVTIGILNYALLGFQFHVDNFYMHSFEIWLATAVVFFGSGTVGFTLLEYRLGYKELLWGLLENIKWIPFFFFFFGGLAIPLTVSILAHMFSYNITWGATVKEVQKSNFFKEVPKILKKYWFSMGVSWLLVAGMIILSTSLVPIGWRVGGSSWGVIFPLATAAGCHILFPVSFSTLPLQDRRTDLVPLLVDRSEPVAHDLPVLNTYLLIIPEHLYRTLTLTMDNPLLLIDANSVVESLP